MFGSSGVVALSRQFPVFSGKEWWLYMLNCVRYACSRLSHPTWPAAPGGWQGVAHRACRVLAVAYCPWDITHLLCVHLVNEPAVGGMVMTSPGDATCDLIRSDQTAQGFHSSGFG